MSGNAALSLSRPVLASYSVGAEHTIVLTLHGCWGLSLSQTNKWTSGGDTDLSGPTVIRSRIFPTLFRPQVPTAPCPQPTHAFARLVLFAQPLESFGFFFGRVRPVQKISKPRGLFVCRLVRFTVVSRPSSIRMTHKTHGTDALSLFGPPTRCRPRRLHRIARLIGRRAHTINLLNDLTRRG